jgi:hypothetical protein
VKKEMRGHLSKTKLPGCYNRLVKLIPWLDDPIGGTHANWKKTGPNHNGVQAPSIGVIGKIGQLKRGWVLKELRIDIWEKIWAV